MANTQINCPQCRQPIIADIRQLFDVGEDPQAKQIFMSGGFNIAQCPHCGYQGMLTSPLVYHDPDKELLLTYFPPELALPIHEQEKVIGPLINRVVNNLPQEERKGYLFNPKTMLTLQVMVETVLEADGITKDMIQAQQERLNLIQQLLTDSDQNRINRIADKDEIIDDEFFGILSRLIEASVMSQDEESAGRLNELQSDLLENSTKGKELKAEADEVQAAIIDLQKLGDKINRENLLDLILESKSDTRLRAYVRLARSGLDYTFFQLLTNHIENAKDTEKSKVAKIREKLLGYIQDMDDEIAQRRDVARQNVNAVVQTDNIKETIRQNIQFVDEFFIEALSEALSNARKAGDLGHSSRLQEIMDAVEELSKPPLEVEIIEDFLTSSDDADALASAIESRGDDVTPELLQMLNTLVTQTQASLEQNQGVEKEQQQILLGRLQAVYNAALKFSMKRSFNRN